APALKRLSDNVLKVAALIAIDQAVDGEIPCVQSFHVAHARHLALQWLDSTLALVDELGRSKFQKDCDSVLATIRQNAQSLKISDLYRLHRRLREDDFDRILSALAKQERIGFRTPQATAGRPAKIVFACEVVL